MHHQLAASGAAEMQDTLAVGAPPVGQRRVILQPAYGILLKPFLMDEFDE